MESAYTYVNVLTAGRLQLAREQVRLDRCWARIIGRLLPLLREVLDFVDLSGESKLVGQPLAPERAK